MASSPSIRSFINNSLWQFCNHQGKLAEFESISGFCLIKKKLKILLDIQRFSLCNFFLVIRVPTILKKMDNSLPDEKKKKKKKCYLIGNNLLFFLPIFDILMESKVCKMDVMTGMGGDWGMRRKFCRLLTVS